MWLKTTNQNDNTIDKSFSIDWKKVNKMSRERQIAYFKNLYLRILKEPVTKPTPILLGNKYFVTDERYKDILLIAYKKYNEINRDNNLNSFEIDWHKVTKMSVTERSIYFKSLIKKIENEPIKNPISFRTKFGFCVINSDKESIYRECLNQYELALNEMEHISHEPKPIETFSKNVNNTSIDKSKKRKSKTIIIPPLYAKPKGRLACSIIAISMVASYSINLVASLFSNIPLGIKKIDENIPQEKNFLNTYNMMSTDDVRKIQSAIYDGSNPYLDSKTTYIEDKIEEIQLERERQIEIERIERAKKLEQKRVSEEKARRVALIDSYFEEYCLYFNLDSDKVIQIAKDKTDNYEINLTTLFEDHLYDEVDEEAAVMVFVRQISRDRLGFKLSELGLTAKDLKRTNSRVATLSLEVESNSTEDVGNEQTAFEEIEKQNKDKLIYLFENMNPKEFLISEFNYSPSPEDLRLLEYLEFDLQLRPVVINVIFNYILGNTDDVLDHSYIQNVAKKWSNINVNTAEEALAVIEHEPTIFMSKDVEEEPDEEEDLEVYSEFVAPTLNEDGVPVARNGEVFSKFIGRISEMIDLDKNYALALCLHETWRGTSNLCVKQNNYGGMRANGNWFTFPSPEAGMIAFCTNLNAYKKYHFETKENPWQSFANVYAEGSLDWQNNVKSFHKEVIRDSEKYFGIEESQELIDETTNTTKPTKTFSMEMN